LKDPENTGMIVVRFKIQCRPETSARVAAALREVIAPSRAMAGVVSFDIANDLTDPNIFVATEVFEDRDALQRQESLPQVAAVLGLLEDAAASEPEATIFHVSSSEPHEG
jgi:quinol monooxygenase YgiN